VRVVVAVFAALLACSSSPALPKVQVPSNVSGDRANPFVIELREDTHGASMTITGRAPRAGTWWYLVEGARSATGPISFSFSLTSFRRRGVQVDFAVLTDQGDMPAVKNRLELPASTASPNKHLVPDPPPPPPCDPKRPDWENPNCQIPCDLNQPDFKNPACCNSECRLISGRCRSKVDPRGATKSVAALSLTTKDHIMVGARGLLFQPVAGVRTAVSDVTVILVRDSNTVVKFTFPERVDPALFADSEVVLSPPFECL
jgi:hypothetical protein